MRLPVIILLFVLAGCAETTQPVRLDLSPAAFADLPGWQNDHQSEALPALASSCAVTNPPTPFGLRRTGKPNWTEACAALAQISPHDDVAARAYLERYFQPYEANGGDQGLFTGYYEAELRGSLKKTRRYHVPLYVRPRDLVTVDLGLFKPDLKGQHITGKVAKAQLVPYDDRAAIEKNSLRNRARVLVWTDDPVDAFFLAIQGSGRVKLPNGHFIRIGYDQANGRAYVAIGKVLADMEEIEKPVTMQKIRGWLATHSDCAEEIMNKNPSYVFFRRIKGDGPVGAEGIALTPTRSLAVDPHFVALGTPLWLDTADGNGSPLERLMIAQDTGGAIRGPIRGDFFWGAGHQAEEQAGAMQNKGKYYLLIPKDATADAGN